VTHDPGCYNRIRFAIDDVDGALRFRRLDVTGESVRRETVAALEAYLNERPLGEVDLAEVRRITEGCGSACGEELIRVIGEQKALFCPRQVGSGGSPTAQAPVNMRRRIDET
jgi:hypothetical protein